MLYDVARHSRQLDPKTLGSKNRLLFEYWQSLRIEFWQGDRKRYAMPARADFNPRRIQNLLSSVCLFEVWPGEGIGCRVAGTNISRRLGVELTGKNYLEFTPMDFRAERLMRFTSYAEGMISRTIREVDLDTGERLLVEELSLPFGDIQENGSTQVIVHVDGTVADPRAHAVSAARVLGPPAVYELYAA